MQATARVSYEAVGRVFSFVNFVTDWGNILNNGMQSTVSERYQNWVDEDGSAAGFASPLLIGSATAEAGGWWRLDNECVQEAREAPLYVCERREKRHIGNFHMVYDKTAQAAVGGAACGNPTRPPQTCTPVGWASHWGWTAGRGLNNEMPLTLNGEIDEDCVQPYALVAATLCGEAAPCVLEAANLSLQASSRGRWVALGGTCAGKREHRASCALNASRWRCSGGSI